MQAIGQPQDIANAVAFLASDAAAYITGETLGVKAQAASQRQCDDGQNHKRG